MNRLIYMAVARVAAGPAFAADIATCVLSADNKTVTVIATNPYAKEMACEVSCDMATPNGFATVVCFKPVPAGEKDFVMCTKAAGEGRTYARVKETSFNCPILPRGPAAVSSIRLTRTMATPSSWSGTSKNSSVVVKASNSTCTPSWAWR